VLGGIRSGKSEFAEGLVATDASVRYVATAVRGTDDAAWAGRIDRHRARRPVTWTTTEVGDDPPRLLEVVASAAAGETLLVDDVGGWVAAHVTELTVDGANDSLPVALATAVRACRARLVLVSPEVGLSVVPATPAGSIFADVLGSTNRAVAAECDAVVLVVAGNAVPVKGAL